MAAIVGTLAISLVAVISLSTLSCTLRPVLKNELIAATTPHKIAMG